MAAAGYASAQQVSRTEEKAAGGLSESADAQRNDHDRTEMSGSSFASAVVRKRPPAPSSSPPPEAECGQPDETKRTRLIGDIMQLIRDGSTPECARVAGLTFVGWLARRRSDEVPHSVGIDEARESESRLRAARAKTR